MREQNPIYYQKHMGDAAENFAKHFLQSKGLTFIQHQFRAKCGEIDLIMKDKDEIVFVEVRFRENDRYGDPEESVSWTKQQRLIRTVLFYQQSHPWTYDYDLRIDVIGVLGNQPNSKITWIPNAIAVE